MTEKDRQYALLLQRQFDSELKPIDADLKLAAELQEAFNKESNIRLAPSEVDLKLAAELQEVFNQESNVENIPSHSNLVYKEKKKNPDDGRSLIDPSWELVDPTPNVHNLFIVFNEQFFWSKLLAVCVSWSKRMTTCAGICSYQGRGGLCSITLSEPLLKLRPRKDLVETLLHEMIHAYLFVTNNNRDRDGHGPEFHKHMNRINGEAGTHISVYHDFHDEVRLYKQHWWRCDGPCQNRKPFFGMVRRAMNRAPGPNDRWFAEHQQSCGGSFIKVKEPEKAKPTKKSKPEPAQPAKSKHGDIRNYITSPPSNKPTTSTTNAPKPTKDLRDFITDPKKPKPSKSNIVTINNKADNPNIGAVFNNGNIHGFKNLGTPSNVPNNAPSGKSNGQALGGGVRVRSNNSNTVVVTGKGNIKPKVSSSPKKPTNAPKPIGDIQNVSAPVRNTSSHVENTDYATVRNHWLSKFESSPKNKRPAPMEDRDNSKRTRVSDVIEIPDEIDDIKTNDKEIYVTCPVCDKKIEDSRLNEHLDVCLENETTDSPEKCQVCNKTFPRSEIKSHTAECFDVDFDDTPLDELEECPVCNVNFNPSKIEAHTKSCLENAIKDVGESSGGRLTQCSVCSEFVDVTIIDSHTEQCLHKMMDDIEDKYNLGSVDEEVCCLVCKKKIVKSELNGHLDECMSGVFDVKDDGKAKIDVEGDGASCSKECGDGGKYNCPFCMEMHAELDMSGHLNMCLKSDGGDDDEKSALMDSFSGDDF